MRPRDLETRDSFELQGVKEQIPFGSFVRLQEEAPSASWFAYGALSQSSPSCLS
jgi:hypothetical protein